jgi:uncharacterized protein
MIDDESPLAATEVHYLTSAHVGDEFKVFVGHCGTTTESPATVLYLTDANGYFGLSVDIIRSMQLAHHLPPMLVVGIGYRRGVLAETMALRTRDLTPTSDVGFADLFPEQAEMGRAADLLAFIQTELTPWVESRYSVDPGDATYFGHSFGGLFGLYVLLNAPQTFRRYVIGSPSLWWNRGVMFDFEIAYADTHQDLPADVFFGIGADETHEGREREAVNQPPGLREKSTAWYIDMVDDVQRLVARLEGRRFPSLSIVSAVFPNEFHITAPPLVLSRGLRNLFGAPG